MLALDANGAMLAAVVVAAVADVALPTVAEPVPTAEDVLAPQAASNKAPPRPEAPATNRRSTCRRLGCGEDTGKPLRHCAMLDPSSCSAHHSTVGALVPITRTPITGARPRSADLLALFLRSPAWIGPTTLVARCDRTLSGS